LKQDVARSQISKARGLDFRPRVGLELCVGNRRGDRSLSQIRAPATE
jgi:hypothetical protein